MRYESIAVKSLGHSAVNMKEREADGTADNGKALKAQSAAFTRDILRGKALGEVNPLEAGAVNWLPNSVFIVERKESDDPKKAPFSVLSGRHRLDWLEAAAAKDSRWNDFQIACEIVTPKDDDERRRIIARGNADAPDAATQIKQNPAKKFAAYYGIAPVPEYVFTTDKNGKPQTLDGKEAKEHWTSREYQNETGIGGSNHVPYSALTRLGRHFNLPVEVFTEKRLRVKPQVTVALLAKTTAAGEGATPVNHLGLGIEPRYILARAKAKDEREAASLKEAYRAEFLALLDAQIGDDGKPVTTNEGAGSGDTALGNEPEKDEATKEAERKANVQRTLEESQRMDRIKCDAMPHAFEKAACARFCKLPNAPTVSATQGNLLDLLSLIGDSAFTDETRATLAAWTNERSNDLKTRAALRAVIETVEKIAPAPLQQEAKKEAAHAQHNTPKKGKK